MFQKIRFRLTLLSGGITTLILVIMTFAYLSVSEKNLLENRLSSYEHDIYNIASTLKQQNILSHTWLANLEANGNYSVSVLDNQIPFLYNSVPKQPHHNALIEQAWLFYREQIDSFPIHVISYRICYSDFFLEDSFNKEYLCYVITRTEQNSCLEMLVIAPLEELNNQIIHQRFVFLSIIIVADFILWLFSWFFTGKLLFPIEENRKKQNHFIAAASHELRTPLAVILSCAEGLQEKQILSQELDTIKNEAFRMSKLLEDMLTLSSNDANQFSIHKETVELDTLLLDVYEAFEPMAFTKKQKISIQLPEELLPPCHCDKERIYQVFTILLHNAISYTPESGMIHLTLSWHQGRFSISFADSGVGIPDEEKEKIFDRFYRSEKARSTKGHFGLGLAIAYEIILAHQGSIVVSDTPNGGATFTVIL